MITSYKIKIRSFLIALLSLIAVLSVCAFIGVRKSSAETKPMSELFTADGFVCEYGAHDSAADRTGALLSTQTNYSKAVFSDFSASFALDFGVVGKDGKGTFGSLAFDFADQATGRSFTLTLLESGQYGNVCVTHQGVNVYSQLEGISFAGGALGVNFDGRDMRLSVDTVNGNTALFNFSSESDMSRMGAEYTLDPFDIYDVTITVSSVAENETAQIYLYELSGEPLSQETLADSSGAAIYGTPALYRGTAGEKYFVSDKGLYSFDLVDGRALFEGSISVKDKNGEAVVLDGENAFVPQSAGVYTAEYRAEDSAGKYGEAASFSFVVSSQASVAQWDMQFPVYEGEVPAGTQVVLPSVAAVSSAATEYTSPLETRIEIVSPGGVQALEQSASGATAFVFSETGTYTVNYTAKDYGGKTFSLNFSVPIVQGDPVVRAELNREMLTGSYLYLNDASQGDKTLSAEAISPSGAKTNYPKVLLDCAGVWTVRYYDGNSAVFEEYVRVRHSSEAFWETQNGIDLEAGAETPEYYDFSATGLGISASLPSGQAFFKNSVDLNGKTKDDKLLEFLVVPENEEVLELDRLELVIRDAYDESNYITIAFEPNVWGYRQLTAVFVSTSDGHEYGGEIFLSTTLYGKFTGGKISTDPIDYDPIITKPFSLYWDGQENAIYMSPARSGYGKFLVADLDAPETFGVGNEWKGFTTGEAEIGFIFREINDTAHIIVTEFDGLDFGGGEIADVSAPSVLIEGEGAAGLAGSNYNCPAAYGVDSVDGLINDVFVEARYVEGTRKTSVPMTDRFSFTPQQAGRYELVYTACDRAGNTGTRVIYIDVVTQLDPIELTQDLSDVYASKMTVGDRLSLRDIEAVGGSGTLNCVKYLFAENGIRELTQKSVLLTEAGDYMLRYAVTDYLENTVNFDFYFTVKESEGPVFSETTVPSYIAANKSFTIPEITAVDYANNGASAEVEIYADGVKVQAGEIISPESDFILKAVAVGADGKESVKKYPVRVISPRNDENFIADHFITAGNMAKEVSADGIRFTAYEDAGFAFLNSLPMGRFTLAFSSDSASFGSGAFVLEFTDSADASAVIQLRFKLEEGRILYSVNGGTYRQISGSMTVSGGFTFAISGTQLQDSDGNLVAELSETLIGEPFEGFTQGRAYVSFGFEEVQGSASVVMHQLCNQVLGNASSDRIRPMIVFAEELVRNASKGDTVVLPDVIGADVLDGDVSLSLLITAPDGSVIFEGDPNECKSFIADQFGVYYLTYTAEDSSENTVDSYASVQVLDYEVPQIEISGSLPATLRQGESFTVPSASVKEGITLKIYLVSPDGVRSVVSAGETVVAEKAGIYRIMFYAYNSDYNSNIIVKDVVVS
ncbi:MAG TPA: hypothetical protein H9727_05975 [Candidatus Borkfalkia avistercoris]|uniref:Uncharacterized protein n=1 Tax=Candidatus Borkfalkia avistercoris TaxID=2838504 RepID=A0A9D2CZN0_9FIRM|nr:hypothetical protein [Candidatus Borkfalkia avistercoris]